MFQTYPLVFKWINLQIQYLCEFQIRQDLLKNLDGLQDTLQETYETSRGIIQQLNGFTPAPVGKTLMWLVCSMTPLEPAEWGLVVEWTAAMDSLDALTACELLHLCRYLVIVDRDSGFIRYAHLSVRGFQETIFSEGEENYTLADSCAALFVRERSREMVLESGGLSFPADLHYLFSHESLSTTTNSRGSVYRKGPSINDTEAYPLPNWVEHAKAVHVHGFTKELVHVSAFPRSPVFYNVLKISKVDSDWVESGES
ncbi:hypothetical protein DFP73DRAFT_530382 [Morchella snyderi]|nr:hypothetical protein DFP73DRAFT_530382 [Morchella snyderi]